jgi:hypothetical protein
MLSKKFALILTGVPVLATADHFDGPIRGWFEMEVVEGKVKRFTIYPLTRKLERQLREETTKPKEITMSS